jgi:hypothetical protein
MLCDLALVVGGITAGGLVMVAVRWWRGTDQHIEDDASEQRAHLHDAERIPDK